MVCLGGSVPCFTTMVVLHDGRASHICILLVIPFLIKLTCVVLRNRLSNVARDSRKCQASAHFLHSSGWVSARNTRLQVRNLQCSVSVVGSKSAVISFLFLW